MWPEPPGQVGCRSKSEPGGAVEGLPSRSQPGSGTGSTKGLGLLKRGREGGAGDLHGAGRATPAVPSPSTEMQEIGLRLTRVHRGCKHACRLLQASCRGSAVLLVGLF